MIDREIFKRAVAAAEARFPPGVWQRLPAGEKAEAIYAELQRLAPGSMKGLIPLNSGPTSRA